MPEEVKKIEEKSETQDKKTENAVETKTEEKKFVFKKFVREGEPKGGAKKTFKKFDKKRGGKFGNRKGRGRDRKQEKPEFNSEILSVRRVTRVVKGGKRMRFSALIVLGDGKGKVGYGIKKGADFQLAIQKATNQAKRNMITINITENKSLDFSVKTKYKAAEIFLKPAEVGTGLIAGSFIRSVLQLAGVENIYSKVIGSNNKISGVQATFKALENFKK